MVVGVQNDRALLETPRIVAQIKWLIRRHLFLFMLRNKRTSKAFFILIEQYFFEQYFFEQSCLAQSTVRKKSATGTFTYNALGAKTLKLRIKTQRRIVSHSNSKGEMLLV